jgi:hypothetical protein
MVGCVQPQACLLTTLSLRVVAVVGLIMVLAVEQVVCVQLLQAQVVVVH